MKLGKFVRVSNILNKNLMGWLPVIDENNKSLEIPYFTLLQQIDNSSRYLIKEGFGKDKFIKIDYDKIHPRLFGKYETEETNINEKCLILVSLKEKLLFYELNGVIEQNYVDVNDIKTGVYGIYLPNKRFGGNITNNYISEENGGTRFAQTWFPIKDKVFEERYIHYGSYSRGCVTVSSDTSAWNKLYIHLMKSRMKKDLIGILKVIDTYKTETKP